MTNSSEFGERDKYLETGYKDITFAILLTGFSLVGYLVLGYMQSFTSRVQKKNARHYH
jgi:hypothetical protein